MKILLYEHVSSGGYAGEPIPASLLSEGFAMLRGVAEDFKAAGHETTVLLDSRIAAFHPPIFADQTVKIDSSGETDPSMQQASETADAALVIAPEADHILKSLVECIEITGTLSLNCQSMGIEQASDKLAMGERAKRLGLNFPKTQTLCVNDIEKGVAQQIRCGVGFPAVIKPGGGAGCSGLSIVQTEAQVGEALAKVRLEASSCEVLAQELVKGIPASISLLCTCEEAQPMSLNLQTLTLASPDADSAYQGGAVPLDYPLRREAFFAAKRLVESFGTLRGYVGVDLVLSDDRVFIIEVNPRLTTSYVGLRNVAQFNVAESIAQAVLKGNLPSKISCRGYSCFEKISVNPPTMPELHALSDLPEIASPPFPLAGISPCIAMVQAVGDTLGQATVKMQEAKKRIQQLSQGGEQPR